MPRTRDFAGPLRSLDFTPLVVRPITSAVAMFSNQIESSLLDYCSLFLKHLSPRRPGGGLLFILRLAVEVHVSSEIPRHLPFNEAATKHDEVCDFCHAFPAASEVFYGVE